MEANLFSQRADLAFAAGDIQTAIRHQKSALKTDQRITDRARSIQTSPLGNG
ncbi:hypothetical protein [Candidatus Villigracilis affinis]|uniref:hypothetical protein n=1 Tax=Candidatus Villigracilis affinis TaxID=3140682 RepID=UPI001DD431DB|nr:hypothetical protein [Anaerolineales bacterium]